MFPEKIDPNLLKMGGEILLKKDLPLLNKHWHNLEEQINKNLKNFKKTLSGDTDEPSSLKCLRVKNAGSKFIQNETILKHINTKEMHDTLKEVTHLQDFVIDRCQAHIYEKGDFLSLHNDSDSCSQYLFSCIFFLSDDYTGGEFILYNKDKEYSFTPPKYSMLILQSGLLHEVKPVLSGQRKVIVFFLKNCSLLH